MVRNVSTFNQECWQESLEGGEQYMYSDKVF
jgi:hypothetical protein